jgi:hypothetical protein
MEGEPLDIQRILYTADKKPRLAIMSIAHLDDAQRMFFVTILLNEILAWIRTQPGTSSLRAVLYMDEVFGYFPPNGNPPAKRPMLTLLKQARAFGLGCMLATQNPVDLDYKGLSNAGTWFLGRLQTARDKARVIEGLEGASAQAGSTFDRQKMEATLAALGNRVFLMNNVHEDAPVVFESRWAMSYLCGPLTKNQIKTLMDPVRAKHPHAAAAAAKAPAHESAKSSAAASDGSPAAPKTAAAPASGNRPVVPAGIREKFLAITERVPDGYQLEYRPGLLARGKVHFVQKADDVDQWQDCYVLQPIQSTPPDDIWEGSTITATAPATDDKPDNAAQFANLPGELAREKSYSIFTRQLKDHLYREASLKLMKCERLDETSKPNESEADFRARLLPQLSQRLAEEKAKLEDSHRRELDKAEKTVRTYEAKASAQRMKFWTRLGTALWVVFDNVMSMMGRNLPGRRRSLDAALRTAATETGTQSNAKLELEAAQKELSRLQQKRDDELKQLETDLSPAGLKFVPAELKPQKGDIDAGDVSLVWLPMRVDGNGKAEPVYCNREVTAKELV